MSVPIRSLTCLLSIALVACGSSDSPSGGSPNGYACAMADPAGKPPACIDCLNSKCAADMTDAYGPSWASGKIEGGACPATFATCVKPCTCNDGACSQRCLDAAGTNCSSAVFVALGCLAAFCANVCQ